MSERLKRRKSSTSVCRLRADSDVIWFACALSSGAGYGRSSVGAGNSRENSFRSSGGFPAGAIELAPGKEWPVDFGALTNAKRAKCGKSDE